MNGAVPPLLSLRDNLSGGVGGDGGGGGVVVAGRGVEVIAEAFVWKHVQFYHEVVACLWWHFWRHRRGLLTFPCKTGLFLEPCREPRWRLRIAETPYRVLALSTVVSWFCTGRAEQTAIKQNNSTSP